MSLANDEYFFYILVAASAVGKSALMREIVKENLWVGVSKYSTRDVRYKDGEIDDVVKIDEKHLKGLSDYEAAQLRVDRIAKLKELCGENKGVVYYKNSNFYGIRIEEVVQKLKINNVVAIISDFHVIKELKNNDYLKDGLEFYILLLQLTSENY